MHSANHNLNDLFAQLGLPSSQNAIDQFIATHRPLPKLMNLADAQCWSQHQAQFLREALIEDSEWSESVDTLDALLRH